jgi:hypothetical protein
MEDSRRERVAARHIDRARRLYGVSETVEPEPATLPVFLSSDEVIGLLAYGRTRALDGPVPGAPPMFERWSSHMTGEMADDRQYPLVLAMRLVLARVRWWQQRKQNSTGAGACPIRPLDCRERAPVRVVIRRHGKTAVRTIALLRMDVRQWIRAVAQHNILTENTKAALCAEIAAGNLVALGRLGKRRQKHFTSEPHEAIPRTFFANPESTIFAGWATCFGHGPDWGDIRFERDEVLRLLDRIQSQPNAVNAHAEVASPTAGHPTIGQETALKNWIAMEMRRALNAPRSKDFMRTAAATEAKLEFSQRAFERAWHNAIAETGATDWLKPGRKSKRRIDTRT